MSESVKLDLGEKLDNENGAGLQLSESQQKSFQEYLDTLKDEEKQEIIYITQNELTELKSILSAGSVDTDGHIDGTTDTTKLNVFITQQRAETITSSEIFLQGVQIEDAEKQETAEKLFEALDTYGYDTLFTQGEAPFKAIEGSLSEDAKRNLSTGFVAFLIEHITQKPELMQSLVGEGDTSKIAENIGSDIEQGLKKMREALQGENVVEQLGIKDSQGEKNLVFMNPLEGKNFFKGLASAEITDVVKYIQEKNQTEAVTVSAEDITKAAEGGQALTRLLQEKLNPERRDPNESLEDFIKRLKDLNPVIGGLLEVLLKFMEGFKDFSEISNDKLRSLRQAFQGVIEDRNTLFHGLKLPENFLHSNEGTDKRILEVLQDIYGENISQSELKDLFKTGGRFSQFMEAGELPSIKDNNNNFNSSLFLSNIISYANYREKNKEHNPSGEAGKNLLYADYFKSLKERGGKIE